MGKSTHGMYKSPEYNAWRDMRQRCTRENHPSWSRYGGRGITVDPRWDSFETFFQDMGPRPGPGYELDRKNNEGPYNKDNCRWVTDKVNARNRSNHHLVTIQGVCLPITEWAERLNQKTATVRARMKKGMTAEEALLLPLQTPGPAPDPTRPRSRHRLKEKEVKT